ncbi:MAG: lysophospholipid acyltransferase family protein [bacterium]
MKSKFVKSLEHWAIMNLALPLFITVLKLLTFTYSFKVVGGENTTPYKNKKGTYIYAFWHRGLIAPVCYYRNLNIATLVSVSLDGEIAARIVSNFGFKVARGSTFKGAAAGLMEIKKMAEAGYDIAMNTDGPRGPEKSVGNGTLYLSKLTGLPIIPFGFYCDKKIRLKSWDKTIIMLPFAKGIFKFGVPLTVPPNATEADMEKCKTLLSEQLFKLNEECEAYFGKK